ncbi:MAG: PQQ-binding-like beta-propeller repeat protein, partial [Fimbriimonadales bacterium]
MNIIRFASITFLILAAVAGIAQSMIKPPFHREWTYWAGPGLEVLSIRGETIFFKSYSTVGAVDIANGRTRWTRQLTGYVEGAAMNADHAFAIARNDNSSRLWKINLSDGSLSFFKTIATAGAEVAVSENRVLVLERGTLMCFDPTTGNDLWSTVLYKGDEERTVLTCLVADGEKAYVGIAEDAFYCLDSASGKVLWSEPGKYGM